MSQPHNAHDGLSLSTLVIAALASAAAAIVTSTFWRGGTIVTAAMTPVIVAIAKEAIARPIQSDLVRRPVERFRPVLTGSGSQDRPASPASAGTAGDEALGTAPIRTYGRPRRQLHIRLALITGAVAFVIAAAVLTVPELLFGGAVVGGGSTTLGGGGASHADRTGSSGKQTSTTGKTQNDKQTRTTPATTPQAAPPARSQKAPPAQAPRTTPSQAQPQTPAPSQPSQQQPPAQSPGVPATPQPPTQGTPAPPAR